MHFIGKYRVQAFLYMVGVTAGIIVPGDCSFIYNGIVSIISIYVLESLIWIHVILLG